MFNKAIAKVFGTSNERAVKRLMPIVKQINDFEPTIQALSDEQLRAKTPEFRQRIAAALPVSKTPTSASPRKKKRSMPSSPRPSPSSAKPASAPSRCATSTSR